MKNKDQIKDTKSINIIDHVKCNSYETWRGQLIYQVILIRFKLQLIDRLSIYETLSIEFSISYLILWKKTLNEFIEIFKTTTQKYKI